MPAGLLARPRAPVPTSNFWWWTGLTAATAAASITLLGIGLHYPAVPVFGIPCIFALVDSLGGVFRYYQVSRSREPEAKPPLPGPVGRPRRDTPSFGDFCASRSDISSITASPTKSEATAHSQSPLTGPTTPPPPPPVALPEDRRSYPTIFSPRRRHLLLKVWRRLLQFHRSRHVLGCVSLLTPAEFITEVAHLSEYRQQQLRLSTMRGLADTRRLLCH